MIGYTNAMLLIVGLLYLSANATPLGWVVFCAYLIFMFWIVPTLWDVIRSQSWAAPEWVDQSHTVQITHARENQQ